MKLKITFLLLCMAISYNAFSQIIGPFARKNSKYSDTSGTGMGLVSTTGGKTFGLLPFRGDKELQDLYDKGVVSAPTSVSFSAIVKDSTNSPSSYIEVLSFIPNNGLFKAGISVQLNAAESSDSTRSPQDVALQKLLNGGGNISLHFGRPIYYGQFYPESYFLVNTDVNFFFDVNAVNQKIYNPGSGMMINVFADYRIYTNKSERQDGNFFRLGVKPGLTYNVFNARYGKNNGYLDEFNNIAIGSLEAYLGIAFLNIKYTYLVSNKKVIKDRNSILELGIVPVKF